VGGDGGGINAEAVRAGEQPSEGEGHRRLGPHPDGVGRAARREARRDGARGIGRVIAERHDRRDAGEALALDRGRRDRVGRGRRADGGEGGGIDRGLERTPGVVEVRQVDGEGAEAGQHRQRDRREHARDPVLGGLPGAMPGLLPGGSRTWGRPAADSGTRRAPGGAGRRPGATSGAFLRRRGGSGRGACGRRQGMAPMHDGAPRRANIIDALFLTNDSFETQQHLNNDDKNY
jgi:hypothetical protein